MRYQRCRTFAPWCLAWALLTTLQGPATSADASALPSAPPPSPDELYALTWMLPGYVSPYEENPIVLRGRPAGSEAMPPKKRLLSQSLSPPTVRSKGSLAVSLRSFLSSSYVRGLVYVPVCLSIFFSA
jgi:hypothetical protein